MKGTQKVCQVVTLIIDINIGYVCEGHEHV